MVGLRQNVDTSFSYSSLDKPPRGTPRGATVLVSVRQLSQLSWQPRPLETMAKRKRTWTDHASETIPESSSQPPVVEGKDASVLDVLPGITRKITACGACRKQKVGDSMALALIGLTLTRPRSNVT